MRNTVSFFKREAAATLLLQLTIPALGVLLLLAILIWRWLAHGY